jgi:hypothetical protein
MDTSRWSPEERSRLYRRQAGRARRAELEAALPSLLGRQASGDWRLLTLEESDQLIEAMRTSARRAAELRPPEKWLPVERADLGPIVIRHAAHLPREERVLVHFYDSERVGLLELSAETFGRAATTLIDLDGNIIGAWTSDHTWHCAIDVDKDDGVEQFEICLSETN